MMLVITELSEAVEADRKGKYFKGISTFEREFNRYYALVDENKCFERAFEKYVKDTVPDEMADAVIRLLDLAGSIDISLDDIYDLTNEPKYKDWDDALKEMSFTERMFFLTSILTNDGDIAEVIKASIVIIFLNADLLYIDLLWHIEQKQKYNELRPYRHEKKY
jgi:hypothetical protein